MPVFAFLSQLPRRNRGEAIDPLNVVFDIPIREVMQRVLQVTDFPIDQNLLMGIGPAPSGPISLKQTHIVVRVPAPSPPPTSEIKNQPGYDESRAFGSLMPQRLPNLIPELRCYALVGIDK